MRDVYELLRQKELQISRLEIEVEPLRVVAPPCYQKTRKSAMTIRRRRPVQLRGRSASRFQGSYRRMRRRRSGCNSIVAKQIKAKTQQELKTISPSAPKP